MRIHSSKRSASRWVFNIASHNAAVEDHLVHEAHPRLQRIRVRLASSMVMGAFHLQSSSAGGSLGNPGLCGQKNYVSSSVFCC
jgi:hypothetical protein